MGAGEEFRGRGGSGQGEGEDVAEVDLESARFSRSRGGGVILGGYCFIHDCNLWTGEGGKNNKRGLVLVRKYRRWKERSEGGQSAYHAILYAPG